MARTIILGDIHGCWDEMNDLFEKVGLTDDDLVVSVGDLVDRGPDPASVVRWFRQRKRSVVVCGNHERKHVRGVLSYSQEITRLQFGDGYEGAVAWMGTLPYSWESDDCVVVHAAMIPGVPLTETPDDVLSGTTSGTERLEKRLGGRWWHELYEGTKPIVFGHHVVEEPLVRDGRIFGIDTGAAHGMRLTALVLPTFELVSVPARADHWKAVLARWELPMFRTRPWASMTFEQIEKRALEPARNEEATAYIKAILAWSRASLAQIPSIAEACDAEIARLLAEVGETEFGKVAAKHPAGTVLNRRHAGRLSDGRLGCSGPGAVAELARKLGLTPLQSP